MNSLTTHTFADHRIRIVTIKDQPWFVAADVCHALGMDTTQGTRQWTRYLQQDEKQLATRDTLPEIFSGSSKAPSTSIISESGLYRMILRSDKPEAKRFQDWVTSDVLPAIRKDGGYIMGEEKVATGELSEDELVLRAVGILRTLGNPGVSGG